MQIISVCTQKPIIQYIEAFQQYCHVNGFRQLSEQHIVPLNIEHGHFWPKYVSKGYQYRTTHLFNRIFFGSHIIVSLSTYKNLLHFYWLGSGLESAALEDLPYLWQQFCTSYEALLQECDNWQADTWFWHIGVRQILKRLVLDAKSQYQVVKKVLRKHLDLENGYDSARQLIMLPNGAHHLLSQVQQLQFLEFS